ncbi:MAG: oligosaccharide flippase family protein, partial [Acidobacteria bacterium]|nr:oligosaccharide flippase family protein [Acidobacteriota bacterium]
MTPANDLSEPGPHLQVPINAGLTTKVVRGSAWSLAGQVLPIAISFISIPFVIRLLGSEGYGVLLLVVSIPTYFVFADLGMGSASTKFESEAYARGDRVGEANVVRTAASLAFVTAVAIAAPLFFFASSIISAFKVPDEWQTAASTGLRIVAVVSVVN